MKTPHSLPSWPMRLIASLFLVSGCVLLNTPAKAGVTFQTVDSFVPPQRFPGGPLLQSSDNTLFGTTSDGGTSDNGTIFSVTGTAVGSLSTFVSFNGTNGRSPGRLILGSDGNFYGLTFAGGVGDNGTVFKMIGSTITNLVFFMRTNGWDPNSLIQGSDGNFYGTTSYGGAYTNYESAQNYFDGTVFRMTPSGLLTTLISFAGPNGVGPGGLIQGRDGNFYGTTSSGGASVGNGIGNGGYGTVFKLSPSNTLTTLASFWGTNGAYPGGVVEGADGNFYGTTSHGGTLTGVGSGTVFKLTPSGALTTLYVFGGSAYGPGALTQGSDGSFYGTTYDNDYFPGPTSGIGTVFRISPIGDFETLFSFNGANGANPGGLIQGREGYFYGTTRNGGSSGAGNVYRLTVTPLPARLISAKKLSNASTEVSFTIPPGQTNFLQASTNCTSWTNLNSYFQTNGDFSFIDTNGLPRRFYRIISQ